MLSRFPYHVGLALALVWSVFPVHWPKAATASLEAIQLLHERCFSCHNEEDRKGDLVLTSWSGIQDANAEFDLVVPGKPKASELIAVLSPDADSHMPPKEQLTATEIATLSRWITEGAAWSETAIADTIENVPPPLSRLELNRPPTAIRPVLAVALSPDGKHLASGKGNLIQLTSIEDPKAEIRQLTGHRDLVRSLTWNPDQPEQLVSGGFRRIVFWDTAAQEPERILEEGLTGQVTALAFSLDGSFLFAAVSRPGITGEVICWNLPSLEQRSSWTAHTDTINSMALSPDGSFLATAGGDRQIVFRETDTFAEIRRIEGHATQIMSLAFSPDSQRLVTAGTDKQLRVWDWIKGDPLFLLGNHKQGLYAVHWVGDGEAILAGDERGALYRYTEFADHTGAARSRTAREKRLRTLPSTIQSLTSSADGKVVVVGTHDGEITIVDENGKVIRTLPPS